VHQFYYQPADTWFGDCMPFFHDGRFYLFHQRDTPRPGPFGEPFGWALARTTDFVTYEDLGESVLRGTDDEQDQFIFAGSVFEAHGTFHAMYTGFNRDYAAQGKAAQVLMIATSDDLIHWTKTGRQLVVPQEGYDPNDWRDPFVLFDDETNRFVMILGARKQGSEILTGRTVWFTSTDLKTWDFQGDFWAPGLFSMHEMPDLFRMGDYWYLLTTEYSDKSKTVYRMSTSLEGPWTAPADDAFDGRAYYAARSIADADGRRFLFGWVPTKENEDEARAVAVGRDARRARGRPASRRLAGCGDPGPRRGCVRDAHGAHRGSGRADLRRILGPGRHRLRHRGRVPVLRRRRVRRGHAVVQRAPVRGPRDR